MRFLIAIIFIPLISLAQIRQIQILDNTVIENTSYFDINKYKKGYKPCSLTNSQLRLADNIIIKAVAKYNANALRRYQIDTSSNDSLLKETISLIGKEEYLRQQLISGYYYVQYSPIKYANGEIFIYANCFCTRGHISSNWKKYEILASDGGNCFFQIIINLTKKTVKDIYINGEA